MAGSPTTTTAGTPGSLHGPRLIYNVTLHGRSVDVFMKESIGKWLGLTPKYPDYGTFGGNGKNKGKNYAKRPGFRGRSWKFLLQTGTKITQPVKGWQSGATGTESRACASFFIGFTHKVTATEAIEFAKNCSKASTIVGVQSDTGRIYRWSGPQKSSPSGGGANLNPGSAPSSNNGGSPLNPTNPNSPLNPLTNPNSPLNPLNGTPLGPVLNPNNPISPLNPNNPLNPLLP